MLNRYVSLQDTLIRIMKEARDQRIDLSGAVTSHPLFGLLKMTAAECFAIVEVHQRRHQWQAEQVLKSKTSEQRTVEIPIQPFAA